MPPMKFKGQTGKAKKGTIKRLVKILFSKYKWLLIVAMVGIIINTISNLSASLVITNITKVAEEAIKTQMPFNESFGQIIPIIIYMACIYAVAIFASYGWNLIMAIITQKYLNELRIKMFDHMETLPIRYFDTHAHGDIMSTYTNDIDTIRQLVSQCLPSIFQTSFSVIAVLVMMLTYSLYLTLIVLAGTIFMFLTVKIVGGKSAKYYVRQQKAIGKVEGAIEETINGLKVIKVFSHEEKSIEDFDVLNTELCKDATVANQMGNIMGPIIGNIGNILYVLLVVFGAIFISTGVTNVRLFAVEPFELAYILGFLAAVRMYTNNINNFSQQVTFIVMGAAGASRVFDICDEESEQDNGYVTLVNIKYHDDGTFEETNEKTRFYAWKHPHGDGTLTYTELKGDIVMKEVDFGYNPNKIVLHDVSIYAKPGQKIAFVGATGAGKTTITNLINRFYDIADGKIRYDGININKIKKDDLRRSLGIVLQDTNLFTGTVMDNIRYGRLDATDEEVYEAAKIANAYDFITRLPQGFNTMLSGDGANLSQGQRQLLSIARAAVADAPVMILDEATSSIDTRTEKLVQEGTDKLMEGRTVFVIAHRLSTVQNSDCIMVLDHGKIIERGTHEDLIKEKGVYYQLYTGAFELE